jgi:hypothetical protein
MSWTSADKAKGAKISRPAFVGWVPIVIFPSASFLLRDRLPPWAFMWLMSFSLFAGCKWLTWWKASPGSYLRSLAYLLLWPGMDAGSFLHGSKRAQRPSTNDWVFAFLKLICGVALIWVVGPRVPGLLLHGWVGMLGLIFLLHFGTFHLIALAWQRLGVDAQPIMKFPIASRSLSEFWGKRWNMGFRQLTFDLVFEPLRRRAGVAGATFSSFVVSGLIHELVISVPARAGYGLPTAYFAIQGAGVLVERSPLGKRLRLNRGVRGWFFVLIVAAAPAYWLFHPWFVISVMVPFLRAIGA